MAEIYYVTILMENPDNIGNISFQFGAWRAVEDAEAFLNGYLGLRHEYIQLVEQLEEEEASGGAVVNDDLTLHNLIERTRFFLKRYVNSHQLSLFNPGSPGDELPFNITWSLLEGTPSEPDNRNTVAAHIDSFEFHNPSDY